jgi:TonB family protein
METAVTPPADADLHLLTDWAEPGRNARIGRSAVLSVLTHVAAIVFVLFMPETLMQPPRPKVQEPLITPLILPPLTLTQTAPNPSKTIREFRSTDLTPRIKAPSGPSPEPRAAAPRKAAPLPPPPPPRAAPQTPLPEPPKLQIEAAEPPKLTLPVQPQVAQPKPPSPFEDVKPFTPVPPDQRVPDISSPSVDGAIRGVMSGRGGANSQGTAPIASSGAELPTLVSDAKGVDFRPYLAQVLASVKRYWLLILPKGGRRGYVSVQFAIRRDGTVGKVSFVQQTGDPMLDNNAIQAISGGGPFGPLPVQYTEAEIHVQMNFSYNQPRQ